MKDFKRYLRLYKIFAIQYTKTIMQSKVDFFMGFLGFATLQCVNLLTLTIVFQNIAEINGYSYHQMIFIYGFFLLPRGLDHLITDNIWILGQNKVVNGEVDRFYLRPINPFFQLIAERLQFDGFGELFLGIAIVAYCAISGVFPVNIYTITMLIAGTIAGTVIYTSIKLIVATLAFWVKVSQPLMYTIYSLSDFAKYPVSIFPKFMQAVIMFIVPVAFVGFIPASHFIADSSFMATIGAEIIVATVLWTIAYKFFNYGLTVYESAGN